MPYSAKYYLSNRAKIQSDDLKLVTVQVRIPSDKRDLIRAEITKAKSEVIRIQDDVTMQNPTIREIMKDSIKKIGLHLGQTVTEADAEDKLTHFRYYFYENERISKQIKKLPRLVKTNTEDYVGRILWLVADHISTAKAAKQNSMRDVRSSDKPEGPAVDTFALNEAMCSFDFTPEGFDSVAFEQLKEQAEKALASIHDEEDREYRSLKASYDRFVKDGFNAS